MLLTVMNKLIAQKPWIAQAMTPMCLIVGNTDKSGVTMTRSLSVVELRAFSQDLEHLGSSCIGLEEVNSALYSGDYVDEDNVHEWLEKLESVAARSQELIARAESMFGNFKSLDEWVRRHNHIEDLELVLTFALGRESNSLSRLFNWLAEDLAELHRDPDRISSYLHAIRANTYNKFKVGLVSYPKTDFKHLNNSPKFYSDGRFRSEAIFKICFNEQFTNTVREIIESSRYNSVRARQWVEDIKLSCCYNLEKSLRQEILNYPVDGLDELRSFLFGAHLPTGEECCARQGQLLGSITFGNSSNDTIKEKINQIKLNPKYYESIYFPELQDWLTKQSDWLATEEFDHGHQVADHLTCLIKHSNLSQDETIAIAMSATASFSRGKMLDLEKSDDATKLRLVLDTVLRNKPASSPIMATQSNFRHVVLTAVVRNLPLELLRDAVAEEDLRKVMIYEMTGNARILNTLKDHRRLPGLMSNDLGL